MLCKLGAECLADSQGGCVSARAGTAGIDGQNSTRALFEENASCEQIITLARGLEGNISLHSSSNNKLSCEFQDLGRTLKYSQ